jgi:hypothetical protein
MRMSDRLLASVIELEKALQEEVAQEEARAAAWQERELAALAAGMELSRQALDGWHAGQTAEIRRRAEAEAETLRAAGAARCARLATLSDGFLVEVLRRPLTLLLPETGDDHSHGQG